MLRAWGSRLAGLLRNLPRSKARPKLPRFHRIAGAIRHEKQKLIAANAQDIAAAQSADLGRHWSND